MNKIWISGLLSMVVFKAYALDLFVDSNTQQIYAEPGVGRVKLGEFEAGVEYQINKALELTVAYASMSRTNIADPLKSDYLKQASGDMIRTQLQVNY